MTFARKFLDIYDDCKESRSPEACRQSVVDAAPALIKTYLVAYDGCVTLFGRDKCRDIFAPPKQRRGVPLVAFLAGLGIALLLGRSLPRR